jgi:RNA polymerase II subunit A C-terminal domain phosphatase
MTHDANGPTVSLREAQRLEKKTAQHLYKSRKLSLIVDLDQTIVHATVDPTVGEWIAEGEAWEARRAEAIDEKGKPNGSDGDDDDDDEVNPNWEALKDVKKFRLAPESFAPHSRIKGKAKARVEDEGCLYYIKPRLASSFRSRELQA